MRKAIEVTMYYTVFLHGRSIQQTSNTPLHLIYLQTFTTTVIGWKKHSKNYELFNHLICIDIEHFQ